MTYRSFVAPCCFAAAAVVTFAITFAQESTGKLPAPASPTQLKTIEEQAAYAIGFDLGEETLANAPDLNPELIARGLLDALKKATPAIPEDKAQDVMSQYMAKKLGPGAEQ